MLDDLELKMLFHAQKLGTEKEEVLKQGIS
jgi:hypothetical protein